MNILKLASKNYNNPVQMEKKYVVPNPVAIQIKNTLREMNY